MDKISRRRFIGFSTAALAVSIAGLPSYGMVNNVLRRNNSLYGNRFLTFNAIVRVNQIEITRDKNLGHDERKLHTPEKVRQFRQAIEEGWPGAKITWGMSWLALHDETDSYKEIRRIIVDYHHKYGDEITFVPGAYYADSYNTRDKINKEITDALVKISEIVGNGYRPKSIVGGFLASDHLRHLAENEGIHVCQGNVWSQYGTDLQDDEGSVCYPYYPSKEHLCKPAQNKNDFIDCVDLDGWTMDFVSARRVGGGSDKPYCSRMGVGPIETFGMYGKDLGLKEVLHSASAHFDKGFKLNKFGWVTNNWEVSLPLLGLKEYFSAIKKRWPDAKCITQGEFGLLWRNYFKANNFDYRFVARGSGIGGSDENLEIRWFMNKDFRLALLKDWKLKTEEQVIDFTRYDLKAEEPKNPTRDWSLMGTINQKQLRPQDKPIPLKDLSDVDKKIIHKRIPELNLR